MIAQHADFARGRWWELSLAEQMSNVRSEVGRALRWAATHLELSLAARDRALELFDLTLDDPRHRRSEARLREIARAREVVLDFLSGPNQYSSSAASLLKYFDAFALAARRR